MSKLDFCTKCERRGPCDQNPNWPPGPHERQPFTLSERVSFSWWLLRLNFTIWRSWSAWNYVGQTGPECWWKMYRDGMTPSDAFYEERTAD